MNQDVDESESRVRALIGDFGSVVVAFSGGVDSAVVMAVAARALGDRVLAVTASSPSVALGEVEAATALARRLGVAHQVIETQEFENPKYRENPSNRCYYCKEELYTRLYGIARERGFACVADGTNADDGSAPLDRRPGRRAAALLGIRSPLLEAGVDKSGVRAIASRYGLEVASKPATPCLSSRVPYGTRIEIDDLRRIDLAERYLRANGFDTVRVRHYGKTARIEVPLDQRSRLESIRERVKSALSSVGYETVEIDTRGYRTGSLNEGAPA
jgi:uncharacterized protein